ncbi:MAG: hypothetical protein P8016_12025, partial [Sedimentisphaerales bacterium]
DFAFRISDFPPKAGIGFVSRFELPAAGGIGFVFSFSTLISLISLILSQRVMSRRPKKASLFVIYLNFFAFFRFSSSSLVHRSIFTLRRVLLMTIYCQDICTRLNSFLISSTEMCEMVHA